MSQSARRRELGRGERVVPGVWRLRLPLPWPGVPHCNAWALADGDGFVLVDTGMHDREPARPLAQLDRALEQVGLTLEQARLIVVTHAHVDHCGQAGPIAQRAGCEVWAHPAHGHLAASAGDKIAQRLEIGLQSGVPEAPLREWLEAQRDKATGMAEPLRPDRDLVAGATVGEWEVLETPGHAPSHVCLFDRERRLLISGDHLLGRVSLYFDHGHTPDPVGEFLRSLDAVQALDARLCLSGHGRPFTDVRGHIAANRSLVRSRLEAVRSELQGGPATAFELAPRVYGERFGPATSGWLLTKLLCYLTHLEVAGEVERVSGEPRRWRLTAGPRRAAA